jgi:hypothetical protein
MGTKPESISKYTETLNMAKYRDGFWLYDKTRGMNLSMRALSETDAFVEALTYYQRRTKEVEAELKALREAVDQFVDTVRPEEGD